MPDESSRSHGPNKERGLPQGDSPHPGQRGHGRDGSSPNSGRSPGGPSPADRQSAAGARVFAVTPGDLDGDGWDQDAAMAAFLADLEAGYDLFTSPIGVEPDELDGPFAGDPGEWPGAAGAAGADGDLAAGDAPAADPAVGDPAGGGVPPAGGPAGGGAGPGVAECLDAGSLPRGVAAPNPSRGAGSGFASGDVLDVALPDPALAGLADAAASGGVGVGRSYARLSDDELIGALGGWRKTEAWAAAGRLSAVAEADRPPPGRAERGSRHRRWPARGPERDPR